MTTITEAVIFSLPLVTPLSAGVLEGRGENGPETEGATIGASLGVSAPSGDCEGRGDSSAGVLGDGDSESLGAAVGLEGDEGVEP